MSEGISPVDGTAALGIHETARCRPAAKGSRANPIRHPSGDVRPLSRLLSVDVGVSPEVTAGLSLLLEAHVYCESLGRDAWDFSVDIQSLRRAGLTNSTLRWMVCKGWLTHALEVSPEDTSTRAFRGSGLLAFDKTTCFVLTESGIETAMQACQVLSDDQPLAALPMTQHTRSATRLSQTKSVSTCPCWDPELHQLRVGELLIKEYKLPCPNQGTILMAFEEEGWPKRIYDPLPPRPEFDPKTRLRYTIKSLNKNQKNRLIRFTGDGTGEGIRWEFLPDALFGRQD